MSASRQLQSILERHCASMQEELKSAQELFGRALVSPARYAELVGELVEIVHRFNGSSGSLGFRTVSAAASHLEHALNDSLECGAFPNENEIQRLYGLFFEMHSLAQSIQPKDSSLFGFEFEVGVENSA